MRKKESFAVVNIKDSVMRYVVGRDALHNCEPNCYHRSSHVIVEVVGGRILIQLKAHGTENEGKWSSSVSGHVAALETYKSAAIREAKEEIGIDISDGLEFICKIPPCEKTGNEHVSLFTYLMDDATELIDIDKEEVVEVRVCKLNDIIKDISRNANAYSPAFILAMKYFLEIYKK